MEVIETTSQQVADALIYWLQVERVKVDRIVDESRWRDQRITWHVWLDADVDSETPTTIVLACHPLVPAKSLAWVIGRRRLRGML